MDPLQLTNVLIGLLIALIGFIGTKMYNKLEVFEKTIQAILMSDISHQKDIENLKEKSKDHEERISEIEGNRNI